MSKNLLTFVTATSLLLSTANLSAQKAQGSEDITKTISIETGKKGKKNQETTKTEPTVVGLHLVGLPTDTYPPVEDSDLDQWFTGKGCYINSEVIDGSRVSLQFRGERKDWVPHGLWIMVKWSKKYIGFFNSGNPEGTIYLKNWFGHTPWEKVEMNWKGGEWFEKESAEPMTEEDIKQVEERENEIYQ